MSLTLSLKGYNIFAVVFVMFHSFYKWEIKIMLILLIL